MKLRKEMQQNPPVHTGSFCPTAAIKSIISKREISRVGFGKAEKFSMNAEGQIEFDSARHRVTDARGQHE